MEENKKKRRPPTKIKPGDMFGRLKVLYKCDYQYISPSGFKANLWHCQCQCENKTELDVLTSSLTSGNTKSCGCLFKEFNKNILSKLGEKYQFKGKSEMALRGYNDYDLSNDYGIGYTDTGEEFYFDLEDYDLIKNYYWKIKLSGEKKYEHKYIINDTYTGTIYMHRLVLGLPSKKEDSRDVDHINHNTFDNQKHNLRACKHCENLMAQKTRKTNTSGRKGVYWDKTRNKWAARITCNKKVMFLGRFDNFEDAVKAREQAEEKYFGEFNYLD